MAKGRTSPSFHEIPLGPGCDFDKFHDFYLAPAFRACPLSSEVAALLYVKITAKNQSTCGDFFFRGWVSWNFFKVTLMSLFEIQNVFMIIKNDVLDRLGHV